MRLRYVTTMKESSLHTSYSGILRTSPPALLNEIIVLGCLGLMCLLLGISGRTKLCSTHLNSTFNIEHARCLVWFGDVCCDDHKKHSPEKQMQPINPHMQNKRADRCCSSIQKYPKMIFMHFHLSNATLWNKQLQNAVTNE